MTMQKPSEGLSEYNSPNNKFMEVLLGETTSILLKVKTGKQLLSHLKQLS